jgi:hypothetical protein
MELKSKVLEKKKDIYISNCFVNDNESPLC